MALAQTKIYTEEDLEIGNYIRSKNGNRKVYPAPFAVRLFKDSDKTMKQKNNQDIFSRLTR